jgi:hypothetical protein
MKPHVADGNGTHFESELSEDAIAQTPAFEGEPSRDKRTLETSLRNLARRAAQFGAAGRNVEHGRRSLRRSLSHSVAPWR